MNFVPLQIIGTKQYGVFKEYQVQGRSRILINECTRLGAPIPLPPGEEIHLCGLFSFVRNAWDHAHYLRAKYVPVSMQSQNKRQDHSKMWKED